MKIKFKFTFKIIFISAIIYLASFNFLVLSFSQPMDLPKEDLESKINLQQAFNNYEAQKQKEKEELATRLNLNLNQAIDDWISLAEQDKEEKMYSLIEQKWEKLPKTIALSPFHYEYYLKGYQYYVTERNVIKTEALTFPYKAIVTVKEEIYAEQYHHANTSNRTDFFYTITTIYTLNFEYREDNFVLIKTDSTIISLKNTAPKAITKF